MRSASEGLRLGRLWGRAASLIGRKVATNRSDHSDRNYHCYVTITARISQDQSLVLPSDATWQRKANNEVKLVSAWGTVAFTKLLLWKPPVRRPGQVFYWHMARLSLADPSQPGWGTDRALTADVSADGGRKKAEPSKAKRAFSLGVSVDGAGCHCWEDAKGSKWGEDLIFLKVN